MATYDLTSPSTRYRSFPRQVFSVNHLQTNTKQPRENKQHKKKNKMASVENTHKTHPKNKPKTKEKLG